ncbi:alpha/beta hydrolase [Candidatus Viridilinea mediisalina]|uniref:Alpha/beta hydrolase n=1 Tax=Candidatus Viridilinea mediisalina TaxID=2024553 RepID=A0A2A6RLF2_9CHLR|nr:alpha/beta hydrolase [Candidatus Viridilinea mediisalina]PDW03934.1 alpha/beta hydrolase [Candidatus Viridilinea mediisalina]
MQIEHLTSFPTQRRFPQPLLLLHGAWHGAWAWEAAMPDLAARGFEVHAISLPGHGNSPAPPQHRYATVLNYARVLRSAIAEVGGNPIVVGHSSGGYVTQLLMTGAVGPRPPLSGAVLLCSSPVAINAYFIDRGMRGVPMVDIRALLRREPEVVRQAFFRPEISPTELERHRVRLVAEPPLVSMSSMLLRPRPAHNRTPVLVIAAERDTIFDLECQQETASIYDAELVVVPEATHDIMLDPAWPAAASAIVRFAAQQVV